MLLPGDDSFQNDFIRRAGGLPPVLGKNGAVVPITLEEWQQFNPQVIFACGHADMANLSVQRADFKDIKIYALVTAGVEGNALRLSQDEGRYYEPGTINIIVLSNYRLSPRAMSRPLLMSPKPGPRRSRIWISAAPSSPCLCKPRARALTILL